MHYKFSGTRKQVNKGTSIARKASYKSIKQGVPRDSLIKELALASTNCCYRLITKYTNCLSGDF